MNESLISREQIKQEAFAAADAGIPLEQANKYQDERECLAFSLLYWERVRDLDGETSA